MSRYKFQPIQRYKALSAEEAEQEFSKRNKHLNYFSLMLRKRLKGDDDAELDGEAEEGKGKKTKSKDLKISDMDEWMDSSSDNSSDAEEKVEEDEKEKNEKKKKAKKSLYKIRKLSISISNFEIFYSC